MKYVGVASFQFGTVPFLTAPFHTEVQKHNNLIISSYSDIDPVKIINVYDRNYDPTQFNLSRKEAMLNFYVIDQKGNRHKNLDAMLFLYWHAGKFPDEGWSSVVGILFYHWHTHACKWQNRSYQVKVLLQGNFTLISLYFISSDWCTQIPLKFLLQKRNSKRIKVNFCPRTIELYFTLIYPSTFQIGKFTVWHILSTDH